MPRSSLLVAALAFMTVVYGCTQDFGQFEPGDGSGGSGPGSGGGPGNGAGPGTGGSVSCDGDADCADSNPCTTEACEDGGCVFTKLPDGPVGNDEPDDCEDLACENGVVEKVDDDGEQPDDGNVCTLDSCHNGDATFVPVALGQPCGGEAVCDGDGHCVGCIDDQDCPGTVNECQQPTCSSSGVCGIDLVPQGTPIGQQTDADCQVVVCDGNGGTQSVPDDIDEPQPDGNMCTTAECQNGVPVTVNDPVGDSCNAGVCNGAGVCVECVEDNDCVGPDVCAANVCVECANDDDCNGSEVCHADVCCQPETCAQLGRSCGAPMNGCGMTLNCNDGVKNGNETDIDCGGNVTCMVKCANSKICLNNTDCVSNKCIAGICQP
ncbi:MAG: hypothetical protein WKG00_39040 [Polyangiaceae bacterium]